MALNLVLFRYALSRYRSEQRVRMDPTGAAMYVRPNADLPPPDPGKPRVVLFGDSRIFLWLPGLRLEGCEVVNRGWSGETTSQGLLRLDRDVIALRPRMVLIQEGINDLKGIGLFPGEEDAISDMCERNMEEIVTRLRDRGVEVVLLPIFPVGPVPLTRRPIWSDRIHDAVARVNQRLAGLTGPHVTMIDCDPLLAEGGRMRPPFALDEFHLTAPAYRALDDFLEPRLSALLSVPKPE
jgi:lysophospholipase L1-like esterase